MHWRIPMKQLSSSDLNNLSKEDMFAMMLQMQQQINALTEKTGDCKCAFFRPFHREAQGTARADERIQ